MIVPDGIGLGGGLYTGLRASAPALDALTTLQVFSTLLLSQTPFSGTDFFLLCFYHKLPFLAPISRI